MAITGTHWAGLVNPPPVVPNTGVRLERVRTYEPFPNRLTHPDFLNRISPEPNTGCWLWLGCSNPNGYGSFGHERVDGVRRKRSAHRYSFEYTNGPIPDGMFVCHRCDTKACVNPDHLFLGTPKDNMQDMIRKGRQVQAAADIQRAKTHCRRGHPFSGDNLWVWRKTLRFCKICMRENQRRKRARAKERHAQV